MYIQPYCADEKDGGFVVIFRDLPEAITQGNLSTMERTLAALGQRIELQITAK
ncbi:MAG: hypothetical protein ACKPJH_19365 [Dolichospermum sp.]